MNAVNYLLDTFEMSGWNSKVESYGYTKRYIFGVPSSFGQKEVWQLVESAKKFVIEDGAPIISTYLRFIAQNTNEVNGFIPPHIVVIDAFVSHNKEIH